MGILIENGHIKLTKGNGDTPMTVNMDKIIYYEPAFDNVGTKLHYGDGYLFAKESYKDIEAAILDAIGIDGLKHDRGFDGLRDL